MDHRSGGVYGAGGELVAPRCLDAASTLPRGHCLAFLSTRLSHTGYGEDVAGVSLIRTPQPPQHLLPILPGRHIKSKTMVCSRT
jgi:hypothetical protein